MHREVELGKSQFDANSSLRCKESEFFLNSDALPPMTPYPLQKPLIKKDIWAEVVLSR